MNYMQIVLDKEPCWFEILAGQLASANPAGLLQPMCSELIKATPDRVASEMCCSKPVGNTNIVIVIACGICWSKPVGSTIAVSVVACQACWSKHDGQGIPLSMHVCAHSVQVGSLRSCTQSETTNLNIQSSMDIWIYIYIYIYIFICVVV